MTLDLDDLRAVLARHAAALDPTSADRAALAQRDGRRLRRGRLAVAGLATVVVMLAALAYVSPGWAHRQAIQPTNPTPTVDGFPEFKDGRVLVAHTRSASPTGLDITFTLPKNLVPAGVSDGVDRTPDVAAIVECDPGYVPGSTSTRDELADLTVQFGSDTPQVGSCNSWSTLKAPFGNASTDTTHHPGQRLSFQLRWTDGQPRADAHLAVGIYANVPIADYEFPTPPAHLVTPTFDLNLPAGSKRLGTIRPGDTSHSVTVRPTRELMVVSNVTAPGTLRIMVGSRVLTYVSWDYSPDLNQVALPLSELGITAGQPVTVTVEGTRFPGNTWLVTLEGLARS